MPNVGKYVIRHRTQVTKDAVASINRPNLIRQNGSFDGEPFGKEDFGWPRIRVARDRTDNSPPCERVHLGKRDYQRRPPSVLLGFPHRTEIDQDEITRFDRALSVGRRHR
ncbi:hypothetical protein CJNNKLLH_2392 [Methylorubrum thiocyanatum]|nr:hypothetical protein CJNNKLLH_2392 [Methylorubrum thiocyanatum]